MAKKVGEGRCKARGRTGTDEPDPGLHHETLGMHELWNGEGNKTHAAPHDLWISCYPLSTIRQAGSLPVEQMPMRGSVALVPNSPHGPSDHRSRKAPKKVGKQRVARRKLDPRRKPPEIAEVKLKRRKAASQRGDEQRSRKVARTYSYGDGMVANVEPRSDIRGRIKQKQSALEDEAAKRRKLKSQTLHKNEDSASQGKPQLHK